MIEWVIIMTIGCIPIESQIEQFGEQVCFLDTKLTEAVVADEESARTITENLPSALGVTVPGSFVLVRYEKRRVEKKGGKGE